MKIRHEFRVFDNEIVPYIYVDLDDKYEFGKDFFSKDGENSFTYKLKKYIDTFLSKTGSGKAMLIVNGMVVGSMSLALFLGLYNKKLSEETCDVLSDSNVVVSEVQEKKKDEDLEILTKLNVSDLASENKDEKESTENKNKNVDISKNESASANIKTSNTNSNDNKTVNSSASQKPSTSATTQAPAPAPTPAPTPTPEPEPAPAPEPVYTGVMVTLNNNGVISNLKLEDYIVGVVAAEMPASFNSEALKAQAVAARTYTMKKVSAGKTLVNSTNDQVYKTETQLRNDWGASFDYYYNRVKSAVDATSGMVMMYGGNYIDALYHSISSGKTELPKYIWNSTYPYLVSVDSSWDKNVKNYSVTKSFSYGDVSSKLGIGVNAETNIEVLSLTESDRVDKIKIGESIFTGVQIRTKLGLRSTDFDIVKTDSGLNITTRGYGHGVGMSQYGANEMAKQGYSFDSILTHYYTNIYFSYVN